MLSIYFDKWKDGSVLPWSGVVEMMPVVALAERRPVSSRINSQMIHPDRKWDVSSIEFIDDGSRIIGGTYPANDIQIWDAATGKQQVTIETPDEYKGSKDFWSVGNDRKIYSYVTTRGKHERVQKDGKTGFKIEFPESRIQVWNLDTGKLEEELQHEASHQFLMTLMAPDKQHLVSFEKLSGTFFGEPERAFRVLNIETGEWSTTDNKGYVYSFDKAGKRALLFNPDDSGRYTSAVSVRQFPSFEEIFEYQFPNGIHNGNMIGFTADEKHVWTEYRTYERKNVWNKWKTSVECFDVASGEKVGQWKFPYDNDSPLFADHPLADGTLVCSTWRKEDKQLIGLSLPDLKEKWKVDIGEYSYVKNPIISPDRKWFAVICIPKQPDHAERSVDWDLVPQNDLKIFDANGKCLETITLPVGCSTLAFSEDGKQAAIGAVGSVWKIDFTRPFENETK